MPSLSDRAYVDFARLHVLHQAVAFFVTRAKSNLDAYRVYSASTNRVGGVIADQTIALDGYYTCQDYPAGLRRIRFNGQDARVPYQSRDAAGIDYPPSTKAAGRWSCSSSRYGTTLCLTESNLVALSDLQERENSAAHRAASGLPGAGRPTTCDCSRRWLAVRSR